MKMEKRLLKKCSLEEISQTCKSEFVKTDFKPVWKRYKCLFLGFGSKIRIFDVNLQNSPFFGIPFLQKAHFPSRERPRCTHKYVFRNYHNMRNI